MIRRFIIGFAIGLFACMAVNVLSAHLKSDCGLLAVFESDACADDIARAGWPFTFYERGGLGYRSELNPPVLFIDLAIGVIVSILCGWLKSRR